MSMTAGAHRAEPEPPGPRLGLLSFHTRPRAGRGPPWTLLLPLPRRLTAVSPSQVLPSPPVPKTTQGFIGWRSGVPGLNKCLEYGSEIRSCKGAYARELGWPKQGIH